MNITNLRTAQNLDEHCISGRFNLASDSVVNSKEFRDSLAIIADTIDDLQKRIEDSGIKAFKSTPYPDDIPKTLRRHCNELAKLSKSELVPEKTVLSIIGTREKLVCSTGEYLQWIVKSYNRATKQSKL